MTTKSPLPPPPRRDLVRSDDPPPRRRGRSLWLAIGVLVAWLVGVQVARTAIGPYPPATATTFFLAGWIPLVVTAIVAAPLLQSGQLRIAAASAIVIVVALPALATSFVPGLRQLERTPVPGHPTMVSAAAPDGNANLYLVADGGTRIERLTSTPETEQMPSLSPDGRSVVFVSDREGSQDLFMMTLDPEGHPTSIRRLTTDPGNEIEPRWSPDGRSIAFTINSTAGDDIALMRPDGSDRRLLTDDHTSFNPWWSPDGLKLVFTRPSPDDRTDFDIWTMRADGSHARDVIRAPGQQYGAFWSPDGRRFAFTGITDSKDVFVANVDGTGIADLTPDSPDADEAYGWSPDGQVLFISDRSHTGGTFLNFMGTDESDVHLAVIL